MKSPLFDRYRENLETQNFLSDPEQERILLHFEELYQELSRKPPSSLLESLTQRLSDPKSHVPKGIYLWGKVGRGKTYLMDMFFSCLALSGKRRVHFHEFMLEMHSQIKESGNQPNPLGHIARNISKNLRVLCIDELFVTDIGDAMILSALLPGLVKEGVILVITSNTKPQALYQKGLHRDRFLPTIDFINTKTKVLRLAGTVDYRLKHDTLSNRYIEPHDHNAEERLRNIFTSLTNHPLPKKTIIEFSGRSIKSRGLSNGVAWFDFDDLCRAPLSNLEMLNISKTYHTLMLSNIPLLGPDDDDAVRRFVELVDQLYDRRVNVIISAMGAAGALYTGTRLMDRFQRSISRLNEFQSAKYVKEPHRQ